MLRALAALAVVTVHAGNRVSADLPDAVARLLPVGHGGVDLFFVLSGFILWSIGRDAPSDPAGFFLRRVLRVAPPWWIAVAAWVAMMLVAGYGWIVVTPAHVAQSLAFVPHYSPTFPDRVWPVLIPGWTLTYEMFFYAVFAATLVLAPGTRRLVALGGVLGGLALAGLLFAPASAIAFTYTSPLLLEFLAGCLVAEGWRRAPGGTARNLACAGLGLGLLAAFGPGVIPEDYLGRTLVFGTASALIVAGAAGLERHLPNLPWLKRLERLGDASYAIYLVHLFLVVPLSEVWRRLPDVFGPDLHGPATACAFVVLCLALSSLAGLVLHVRLELPLHRSLLQVAGAGRSRATARAS